MRSRTHTRTGVWCYEVKSCLADFESGNGLTFYGDENFLVTTRELAEQLHEMLRLPRNINQVLVPTPKGDRLQKLYDLSNNGSASYRHRPASEMLYAMIEANGQRPVDIRSRILVSLLSTH